MAEVSKKERDREKIRKKEKNRSYTTFTRGYIFGQLSIAAKHQLYETSLCLLKMISAVFSLRCLQQATTGARMARTCTSMVFFLLLL